jgi:hypothetical protein
MRSATESAARFVVIIRRGWLCLGRVWQAGGMKKQGSDQAFHDRRYQERKRAEAERKVPAKKKVAVAGKPSRELPVPSS